MSTMGSSGRPQSRRYTPREKEQAVRIVHALREELPLLFELAHIGSILDPSTDSTEPRFEGRYGDHDKIGDYMDELRRREGLPLAQGGRG